MKTKIGFVQIIFVFLSIALPTITQGVIPAPDGGYPGGNTAEGQNALFSLTTGADNTAVGFYSMLSDRVGGYNTAVGAGTLPFNTADANTATGALARLSNTTGRLKASEAILALKPVTFHYKSDAKSRPEFGLTAEQVAEVNPRSRNSR